ncbi:hypothetical protein AMATHDRAFT_59790 [Amanita thiersii Skay4041]|uniref:Transmembrane protein 53 n=1 Tax=Amanita thiersii Skay4041 TaxID=703135 RepID=A0A2A9NKI5_9AGAR|nr:hypothetical protein AMATHDRAFT_59790 [Amanita thiersii Skay4041]
METQQAAFTVIGDGVLIKRPLNVSQQDETRPTLIIIFGWMGAKLPHLQKYTAGYDQLYPNATQILVRCEAVSFWMPEWMKRNSLHSVIQSLEALGCITKDSTSSNGTNQKHRILVHVFSNGGCVQLLTLRRQLGSYQTANTSSSAIIFDSCPGSGSLDVSKRAFASVVRFAPLRVLVTFCLYIFYFISFIRRKLFGVPTFFERMRIQLAKASILPWLHKGSPRLYVYSKKDDLIPWMDVEAHAQDAEACCQDVRMERYETSMHVAHIRQDPERYWRAIQELWNAACKE